MTNAVDLTLVRTASSDQGTRGVFFTEDDVFRCFSLELPWRENRRRVSCIPAGEYKITFEKLHRPLAKRSELYLLHDVPDRDGIFIHIGNVGGDEEKGYKSHILGCILLGEKAGHLYNQWAVLQSAKAIDRFHAFMQGRDGRLKIVNNLED